VTWIKIVPRSEADPHLQQCYDAVYALYPREYGIEVAAVQRTDGSADSIVATHSLIPEALRHALSTLGVLLASVTPSSWLKVGSVAMACGDTWLVGADLLQAPNTALIAAHPVGGLPRLQSELFGSVSMGYGDMFVAALLGAVLAGDRRRQWSAAVVTLALAAAFDLLFLVVNELPATVPVAAALIVVELWGRRGRLPSKRASRTTAAAPPGRDRIRPRAARRSAS